MGMAFSALGAQSQHGFAKVIDDRNGDQRLRPGTVSVGDKRIEPLTRSSAVVANALEIPIESAIVGVVEPVVATRVVASASIHGGIEVRELCRRAPVETVDARIYGVSSGLDIDALRIVANGVNTLRSKDNAIVLVTHYQRLLDYIVPDYVHVLADGKIIKSGTKDLALELEEKGYDWLLESQPELISK